MNPNEQRKGHWEFHDKFCNDNEVHPKRTWHEILLHKYEYWFFLFLLPSAKRMRKLNRMIKHDKNRYDYLVLKDSKLCSSGVGSETKTIYNFDEWYWERYQILKDL